MLESHKGQSNIVIVFIFHIPVLLKMIYLKLLEKKISPKCLLCSLESHEETVPVYFLVQVQFPTHDIFIIYQKILLVKRSNSDER